MTEEKPFQQEYKHQRRSVRLAGFDYSQIGEYSITICTQARLPIFGEIREGAMQLSEIGMIVKEEWEKTPLLRPSVELGVYAIMPNHFHAIVHISGRGTMHCAPTTNGYQIERFGKPTTGSIPTIVRCFKAAVTRRINQGREQNLLVIWQRNYYEHVVKSDEEYERIEGYISENPLRWLEDEESIK